MNGTAATTLRRRIRSRPATAGPVGLTVVRKASQPRPRASRLDLAGYSEAARQGIYDAVVREYFTRKQVGGVEWDPIWEPGEAQLQVLFLFGRWLVTWWVQGEHEKLPEHARRELLLVEQDERGRLTFREI